MSIDSEAEPVTPATEECGADTCPIAPVIDLFGNRWKHRILWHLQHESIRFNELRRRLPGITPRTLTRQLRDLERDGLVHREQFSEIPPRVVYSSTPLAESLRPVFSAVTRWGAEHLGSVAEARERYGRDAQA